MGASPRSDDHERIPKEPCHMLDAHPILAFWLPILVPPFLTWLLDRMGGRRG